MKINCVWEHNGNDTLLYAADLPGAYTRGESLEIATKKMESEVTTYLRWIGKPAPEAIEFEIIQNAACDLEVRDADSDVLFDLEIASLSQDEYMQLRDLALKSAADFLALYESIPNKSGSVLPYRKTFYGMIPRTAEEMYQHTKNVNAYYFGEIEVDADNEGSILECRRKGFDTLERTPNYLNNTMFEGSYGECWTLRKVLRRFIWHDRIHAKAMYRMAVSLFGQEAICDPFLTAGMIDKASMPL